MPSLPQRPGARPDDPVMVEVPREEVLLELQAGVARLAGKAQAVSALNLKLNFGGWETLPTTSGFHLPF